VNQANGGTAGYIQATSSTKMTPIVTAGPYVLEALFATKLRTPQIVRTVFGPLGTKAVCGVLINRERCAGASEPSSPPLNLKW